MKEIHHNGERVGVRGRFTFGEDGLRSRGPDLRLLGVEPGQWLAVYGDSTTHVAYARVVEAQSAECIRVERIAWGESPPYQLHDYPDDLQAFKDAEREKALKVLAESAELSVYISRPLHKSVTLS